MPEEELNPFTGRSRQTPDPALVEMNAENDSAPGEAPKKRRGRPPGSGAVASKADSLTTVKAMLAACNIGLTIVSPVDVLTEQEIDALAGALIADPYTAKWIGKTAKGAAHIQLTVVLVQITLVRLHNHGIDIVPQDAPEPKSADPGPAYEQPQMVVVGA